MNFALLLPLIEMLGNTTLTVLSTQGIVPANSATLASALESAIIPLIASITNKSTKTADVMAAYGAMIGVLNALKQNTALPKDVLAKVEVYLSAAQDATTAYLAASKGFDANLFTPLAPIV